MYYNQRREQDYLMHYGVLGMRWGHRKRYYNSDGSLNRLGKSRMAYKDSKKEFKRAANEQRRSAFTMGHKGLQKFQQKQQAAQKAELNMINKKAKYKAASAKTKEKAAKKEFKTYAKEMRKSGLAGSAADTNSGGRSSRIYKELSRRKGKDYADKVSKKVQNQAYANIAAGTAVAVGSLAVQAYINRKYLY